MHWVIKWDRDWCGNIRYLMFDFFNMETILQNWDIFNCISNCKFTEYLLVKCSLLGHPIEFHKYTMKSGTNSVLPVFGWNYLTEGCNLRFCVIMLKAEKRRQIVFHDVLQSTWEIKFTVTKISKPICWCGCKVKQILLQIHGKRQKSHRSDQLGQDCTFMSGKI